MFHGETTKLVTRGFVTCFSIIHVIWSLFLIFFSFSNCRDRCSTMRARFRVATSSFCFPHEFPHLTPSISDGSLKKSSYNYWFKGEKYGRNENENFSYRNLSILIQLPFSKQHQCSHYCRDLIWRCNNANFRYSRKSKKKKKKKSRSTFFSTIYNPYFSNIRRETSRIVVIVSPHTYVEKKKEKREGRKRDRRGTVARIRC